MGILDSLKSFVNKVLPSTSKPVDTGKLSVVQTTNNLPSSTQILINKTYNPSTVAKPSTETDLQYALRKTASNPLVQTLTGAVVATGTIASGGTLPLALGLGAVGSQVPKVLVSNPKAVTNTLSATGAAINTAGNIAAQPSSFVSETTKFVKENPVASAVIGGAVAVGLVKSGALGLVSAVENKSAVNKLIENQTQYPTNNALVPIGSIPNNAQLAQPALSESVPITPSTQVIGKSASKGTTKKKNKRSSRNTTPSIRVNILNEQINI